MRSKKKNTEKPKRRMPPATTPEGRENQLISYAMDLAEEQLRNGTASQQVISHFLKLGSTKEELEKQMMEHQKELLKARAEAINSNKKTEELYINAMNAMRSYSGSIGGNEYDQNV